MISDIEGLAHSFSHSLRLEYTKEGFGVFLDKNSLKFLEERTSVVSRTWQITLVVFSSCFSLPGVKSGIFPDQFLLSFSEDSLAITTIKFPMSAINEMVFK
jgi:hypothetical protein